MMHYIEAKNILSNKNGMNIYRGCEHGCIYCDTRSKCYGFTSDFEDIEVKVNSLELLEKSLISKRHKCMIGTGSMSDPYMPLEQNLEYTRKALKLIEKYGFGATLITKSDLVLRDLDLLKSINEKTKCVIQMTLTTYDDDLAKIIEPNVCVTSKRFKTLEILRDNNIPTIIWLTPILPFINDSLENLKGILDCAIKAKVKGIICFGFGLTLREGNREYFYQKLDESFPGIKDKYIKYYGDCYVVNSFNNKKLWDYFVKTCKENNIEYNYEKIFNYLSEFESKDIKEQTTLF